MQTEKRHPIAHALHIIGTGRTTLNNYIYGPGAILSAIFGEAGESLENHIGPNRAPVCENQRWLRRYLTDEAVVVLSIGFRLIRYGIKAEEAFRLGFRFAFGTDAPEGHPVRWSPLYPEGETILIINSPSPITEDAGGRTAFAFVSDRYHGSMAEAARLAGHEEEGEPLVVLNLSHLCRSIALWLGEDPTTFMRPAAQVAA